MHTTRNNEKNNKKKEEHKKPMFTTIIRNIRHRQIIRSTIHKTDTKMNITNLTHNTVVIITLRRIRKNNDPQTQGIHKHTQNES